MTASGADTVITLNTADILTVRNVAAGTISGGRLPAGVGYAGTPRLQQIADQWSTNRRTAEVNKRLVG